MIAMVPLGFGTWSRADPEGVFKTWLASQPNTWRERIEIVAMDGFTGLKSAAAEELPRREGGHESLPRRTPCR